MSPKLSALLKEEYGNDPMLLALFLAKDSLTEDDRIKIIEIAKKAVINSLLRED